MSSQVILKQTYQLNTQQAAANKIIFDGYYGQLNTGDDAFVEVSAWGAETYWNTANNFFLAKSLPLIKHEASHFQKKIFTGQHVLEQLYQLINTNAVISSGGSTFEKPQKMLHIRNLSIIKKILIKNFKIGAIGVSLGPYKNASDEKSIIEYLKRLDFLALRDEHSYQLALSYQLPYKPVNAFDLAALLPRIYDHSKQSQRDYYQEKIIGVSACFFERYRGYTNLCNEERRTGYLKQLLLEVSKITNAKLRFFEFNGNSTVGDLQITASIIDFLKENKVSNVELIPYNPNINHIYNKVLECNLMISVRLHASMFACFGNVPFFLLEYHRKCSDFLESVGYKEAYRIGDGMQEIQKTIGQIISILEDPNRYTPPTKLENCKQKALMNFTSISL
ncbi:polysaccharide pyruvyl transferase family protein [Pontibacter lucknowensis]|uniref:Polysaccharide pyruvyl transferase family protein WcaK n=1 Tax=Pontibacter lucknowensis TaxID=1077936 RepID=A0A1N7AYL3_9BACT|nr:polysaccharide pyruvyl transferase family protein [Pontibacter lucknowensis]SIR44247.1 Polysaccharide pyruvyl transferase family protein WcaK [Pontibacter lucknowensis]